MPADLLPPAVSSIFEEPWLIWITKWSQRQVERNKQMQLAASLSGDTVVLTCAALTCSTGASRCKLLVLHAVSYCLCSRQLSCLLTSFEPLADCYNMCMQVVPGMLMLLRRSCCFIANGVEPVLDMSSSNSTQLVISALALAPFR